MIVTSSGDGPAASARTSLVTLINSAVGVGVLSLPYAFRCAGWAGGLFLIATIASTEAFTLYVLSRYAELTRASSYSSMVHRMLGSHASYALGGILLSYLFGSCVAYLIILADCLHPIAAGILGEAWFTSRAAVLVFAAVFIVLPLCLPDTLDAISGIGVFALYGIGIMVGLITYRNVEIASRSPDPWEDLVAWNWSMDFFSALPIVIFGMQCHCQVITVFRELEAEPRILRPHRALRYRQAADLEGATSDGPVRESVASSLAASPEPSASNLAGLEAAEAERTARVEDAALPYAGASAQSAHRLSKKLRGMRRVVMTAIGLTSVGYTIIGLTGYVAFPRTAMSNILNNFSQDDLVVQVARALVGAMKVVSYPINHNPARRALKDVMEQATGRSWEGPLFHYGATLLFFGATLALALRVHDLGVVFKVIGGTNGAVLIFTLPGLMLVKYSYAKHMEWQRYLDAQRGDAPRESARDALLPPADADASRYASLPQPYHYLSSKLWWSGVALVAFSVAVCIVSLHNIFFPAA